MAQVTEVHLVDDIDGGVAAETVTFGLDGRTYEIDLSETNAKDLRASLAGFIESGRRVGGRAKPQSARTAKNRDETQAIREWAKSNGMEVKDRGRIPAAIVEAYHQAA